MLAGSSTLVILKKSIAEHTALGETHLHESELVVRSFPDFEKLLKDHITEEDWDASYSVKATKDLYSILQWVRHRRFQVTRLLDLGCGYGGLTSSIGAYFSCQQLFGIEIDNGRASRAQARGVKVFNMNLEEPRWPLADNSVDAITSWGVLEHVPYWDNTLAESNRTLCKGGIALFSIPNAASYLERVTLLMGRQPRNVEVSKKVAGDMLFKRFRDVPIGHLHTLTLQSFRTLLERNGLHVVHAQSLRAPIGLIIGKSGLEGQVLDLVDRFFSIKLSLSRRFVVVAVKLK